MVFVILFWLSNCFVSDISIRNFDWNPFQVQMSLKDCEP
jgi:hypothetical protein